MEPRIVSLPPKRLIGKRLSMSLANNKTAELWQSFMVIKREIKNSLGTDLYSMQVYDQSLDFKNFKPSTVFEKWAAIEVSDFSAVHNEMEKFNLEGGLYVVFIHKGAASTFAKTFHYIFSSWLPNSDYTLDARPHFEILGKKYKNNDPNSEEEVWIPVRLKK